MHENQPTAKRLVDKPQDKWKNHQGRLQDGQHKRQPGDQILFFYANGVAT